MTEAMAAGATGPVRIEVLPAGARFSLRVADAGLEAAARAFDLDLPARIGARRVAGGRSALCLGPDEWVLHAPEIERDAVVSAFAGIEAPLSLVDISDREIAVLVDGKGAALLLAAGCPRDMSALPVGSGTRTVFEGAQIVLVREGPERFRIETWRSFLPHVLALLHIANAELAAGL